MRMKFTLKNWYLEGVAQLCSVEVLEFGNEEEYVCILRHDFWLLKLAFVQV